MSAQSIRISGTVKDAKGEPVVGAVIMQQGNSKSGAVSDLDGNFIFDISDSGKHAIIVNCVGFKEIFST